MEKQFDVVVLGGGPGGSSSAGYLAKAGYKVALIEEKAFPRFRIGESLLPYSMEIFKDLGFTKVLEDNFLAKHGAEFIDFRNDERIRFDFSNDGKALHPHSYEVERAKFDHLLLDHVEESFGVEVFQPEKILSFNENQDSIHIKLEGERSLKASYIIDATGKASFFGSKYSKRSPLEAFNDLACFGHFKNFNRKTGKNEGDISIGIIGDGAWTWCIPLKGEVTSLGVVCSKKTYKDLDEGVDLFEYFQEKFPVFKEHLKGAELSSDLRFASNYSFSRDSYFGDRWLLVGDSMGFLDPVFSTGVHIALYSGKLAALTAINALEGNVGFSDSLGEAYSEKIKLGYKRFSGLLQIFYDPKFLPQMKKTLERDRMRQSFTELVAGGAWQDENLLFRMGVV